MNSDLHNPPVGYIVSIIIATKNSERSIEACIRSAIEQTIKPEILVIDGKSSDSTLAILGRFRHNISRIVSEHDSGIYDALNKGVRLASGKFIYILGSDDCLASNNVLGELLRAGDSDIIYGDVYTKNINGKVAISRSFPLNNFKHRMPFSHQGVLVKRDLLLQHPFGKSPASDYRFLFSMYLRKKRFKGTGIIVACYSLGGYSDKNQLISTIDRLAINFDLRGIRAADVVCFYSYHILRSLLRYLFRKLFQSS